MKTPKVQARLAARIAGFNETMRTVATGKFARGFRKPGSQNPRKR